jgi:hypothetical protein
MYETKEEFVAMLRAGTRALREAGTPGQDAFLHILTDVLWQYDQFFLSVADRLKALEDAATGKKP